MVKSDPGCFSRVGAGFFLRLDPDPVVLEGSEPDPAELHPDPHPLAPEPINNINNALPVFTGNILFPGPPVIISGITTIINNEF